MHSYQLKAVVLLIAVTTGHSLRADVKPGLRRPVGMALSPDGGRLFVANRDSGTLSIVDVAKRAVVDEVELGGRLSGIVLTADGKRLLLTDERNHRLLLLTETDSHWKVVARLTVPDTPAGVVIDREGKRCYVTSLWPRSVTVIDVGTAVTSTLRKVATIALPFEPRNLCLVEKQHRLLVAGSFAGRLAVVDTIGLRLIAVRKLQGHNIRGLALSADGKRLLTAQQLLNPIARSTFDDVHWGNMVSNVLFSFALTDVFSSTAADLRRNRQEIHLGEPDRAAGDPGAIAVSGDRVAVALSGVGEVAIGRSPELPLSRVGVGRRPVAVAFSADGKRVYTADLFADSISIVDAETAKRIAVISLGRQPKRSLVERGEELFFDARISHNGWMSCQSCHTDGHANGMLNDNLSDGSFGAAKRVLSLLGVAQTGPWAWSGAVKSLEQQVRTSITKTMQGKPPRDEHVAALVAYLKTLKPAPPPARFDVGPKTAELTAGKKLFAKLDCRRCHTPPTYTSPRTYDVGLRDGTGNTKFNPPSLRGVGRRSAFFHDGRAASLHDVFDRYRHQLPRGINRRELGALVEFLRSL